MLSASLASILAIFIGLIISLLIYISSILIIRRKRYFRDKTKVLNNIIYSVISAIIIIFVINYLLNRSFTEPFLNRVFEIINFGIRNSNRGFIYDYVDTLPIFHFFGLGLGNIQIAFADHLGDNKLVSLLNIYLNIYYSCGLLLFIAFMIFFLYPLIKFYNKLNKSPFLFYLFWGYISWLIIFTVSYEEFTIMFGVIFGLLWHRGSSEKST